MVELTMNIIFFYMHYFFIHAKHFLINCLTLIAFSLYRGQLNLNLLPSSNMHISFIGDDGCTERLAVLSNEFDSSDVSIEEISADTSGRSFLLKFPGHRALYYWCSEKSKLHGLELVAKVCFWFLFSIFVAFCSHEAEMSVAVTLCFSDLSV